MHWTLSFLVSKEILTALEQETSSWDGYYKSKYYCSIAIHGDLLLKDHFSVAFYTSK
jgi:hypothetical protein